MKIEQPLYHGNVIRMLYDDTNLTDSNFKNIASILKIVAGLENNSTDFESKDTIVLTGLNIEKTIDSQNFRITSGVLVSDRIKYPLIYKTDGILFSFNEIDGKDFYISLLIEKEKPLLRRIVNPQNIENIQSITENSMQYLSASITQTNNNLNDDTTIKLGSISNGEFIFDESIDLLWNLNRITSDLDNSLITKIEFDGSVVNLSDTIARRDNGGMLECISEDSENYTTGLLANYKVVNERRLYQVIKMLKDQIKDEIKQELRELE